MPSIVSIFVMLLDLVWYLLLAQVILSWLTVFGIRNDLLRQITLAVSLLTQPILDPIRRALPKTGSFDFQYWQLSFSFILSGRCYTQLCVDHLNLREYSD